MMRSALLALALAAPLAGCDGLSSFGAPIGDGANALALDGGALIAAAPHGYCVDPRASRPAQGFALFAGCSLISALDLMPYAEALLSIQADEPGSAAVAGQEQELAALLQTPQGAALLSAAGSSDTVTVDRAIAGAGLVMVHFDDTASPPAPGIAQSEWRAFLDLNGRLVTIALRGLARAPLSDESGFALLRNAAATLRAANVPEAASAAAPG